MASGYIKSKPDVSFWHSQVQAGIKYRKELTYEHRWETWNKYYRGKWTSRVIPVNMFFAMLRQTVPRVYFRSPAVSISPDQPGFMAMAFAQILERIDNRVFREMGLKKEMKRLVQETWLKGTSFGKMGLGAEYSPGGEPGFLPLDKGEKVEYNFNVRDKFPWFKRTPTGTVILPDGIQHFEDARWWAHHIRRTKDDLLADKRVKSSAVRDIPGTAIEGLNFGDMRLSDKSEMVDLLEVHDRKFGIVFVISMYGGSNDEGIVIPPTDDALSRRRPNIYPLIFNPDDDYFWGVPDAAILEPSQLELNETNTLIMKHRRLSLLKLMYKRGSISEEELVKLLSEDVGAAVAVDGDLGDVDMQQIGDIPQGLINAKSLTMQDVRDQMGFSRNQLGEFQSRRGDTSATEAAIVNQGSEIRIDERRDAVADLLELVAEDMNEIIFTYWDQVQVFQLVGPGGVPVWVQAKPSQLSLSRYQVRVDADSGLHKTREVREKKAVDVYTILKQNPFIDPIKLTQYLLKELEGVQLDDLMRALPPVPGFGGQTLTPDAYGGLIQGGFQQLAAAGPQAIPAGGGQGGA